jgi:hypothetical protein
MTEVLHPRRLLGQLQIALSPVIYLAEVIGWRKGLAE